MKEIHEIDFKSIYKKYLKDIRWREFRLKVFEQDKYTCQICFKKFPVEKLQAHHKKYINGLLPWEYPVRKCVTLCNHCHKSYHDESKIMGLIYKLISIFRKAA